MHHSIFRFLLFLVAEFFFIVASTVAVLPMGLYVMKHHKIKNSLLFWMAVGLVVVSDVFLFVFIWILTGERYVSIFTLILVLTVVLMLAVELLWLLIGSQRVPWAAITIWTTYEFQQRWRVFQKIIQVLGPVTILLIFPIYIGYGFFHHALTQEEWVRYVFRSTLLFLIIGPQLFFLPQNVFVLTSRNVLGDTRSRIFIGQLGNAVSLLILASLFIWSLGSIGVVVPVLGSNFIFSPIVLYATLVYVAGLIFIPYIVGHYRAKDWSAYLETTRSDLVDELSKGLMSPNWGKVDLALTDAESTIQTKINEIEQSDMQPAEQIVSSDKETDLIFKVALEDEKGRDPRFVHVKILREIDEQIKDCRTLLAAEQRDRKRREIVDRCAALLARLIEHHDRPTVRPWVLGTLTALFLGLANPFLASAGKFAASKLGIPVENKEAPGKGS